MSIGKIKNKQVQITYFTKGQGTYQSPKFNRVKIKQSKLGPIQIHFYYNNKLVAIRDLKATDATKLERIND